MQKRLQKRIVQCLSTQFHAKVIQEPKHYRTYAQGHEETNDRKLFAFYISVQVVFCQDGEVEDSQDDTNACQEENTSILIRTSRFALRNQNGNEITRNKKRRHGYRRQYKTT